MSKEAQGPATLLPPLTHAGAVTRGMQPVLKRTAWLEARDGDAVRCSGLHYAFS
jgi:hypothetical protein